MRHKIGSKLRIPSVVRHYATHGRVGESLEECSKYAKDSIRRKIGSKIKIASAVRVFSRLTVASVQALRNAANAICHERCSELMTLPSAVSHSATNGRMAPSRKKCRQCNLSAVQLYATHVRPGISHAAISSTHLRRNQRSHEIRRQLMMPSPVRLQHA